MNRRDFLGLLAAPAVAPLALALEKPKTPKPDWWHPIIVRGPTTFEPFSALGESHMIAQIRFSFAMPRRRYAILEVPQ